MSSVGTFFSPCCMSYFFFINSVLLYNNVLFIRLVCLRLTCTFRLYHIRFLSSFMRVNNKRLRLTPASSIYLINVKSVLTSIERLGDAVPEPPQWHAGFPGAH